MGWRKDQCESYTSFFHVAVTESVSILTSVCSGENFSYSSFLVLISNNIFVCISAQENIK